MMMLVLVAYVPSMVASVESRLWSIAIVDTVALLWVVGLFFARRVSTRAHAVNLIAIVLALSVILLATLGPLGAGFLWLFAFCILSAVAFGLRGAVAATVVAVLVLLVTGFAGAHLPPPRAPGGDNWWLLWAVMGGNLALLAGGLAIAVGVLMRGLEGALAREHQGRRSLARQHAELLEAHRSLEAEMVGRAAAERDRASLRERLQEAARLESLGTLARGIAHDMNNLLQPIMTSSEVLKLRCHDDPEVQSDVAIVLEATGQARELVRQILDLSKRRAPCPEVVDLCEVARGSRRLLDASMPPGLELGLELESEPARVIADRTRLHQIVMNLCVNAAQAIDGAAGRIVIRVTKTPMSIPQGARHRVVGAEDRPTPAHGEVFLSVADSGVGIADEALDHLFEPLFTTRAASGGTGLGLATVRDLVEGMGGTITVITGPDVGTSFTVSLPLCAS